MDLERELKAAYPAITRCRIALDGAQAHVEILLPQHQIIVNAAADTAERALTRARATALAQLAGVVLRDRSLAPVPAAEELTT